MSDEQPDRTGTYRVTDETDDGTQFIVEAGCTYWRAIDLLHRLLEAHAKKPRIEREDQTR